MKLNDFNSTRCTYRLEFVPIGFVRSSFRSSSALQQIRRNTIMEELNNFPESFVRRLRESYLKLIVDANINKCCSLQNSTTCCVVR
jgi:hypothetical protein